MQIDPKDYDGRRIYFLMTSCLAPRPIAWVSSISRDGVRNLAPFSYFTPITSKPPLLCISVARRRGKRKDTANNASSTGELVVNVVTEPVIDKMVQTGADYPPEVDEIAEVGLTPVDSVIVKPPRIAEAPIQLECRVQQIIEISPGSVDLIVAEVLLFHIADDLPIDEDLQIPTEAIGPVGRLGGSDYSLMSDVRSIQRAKP